MATIEPATGQVFLHKHKASDIKGIVDSSDSQLSCFEQTAHGFSVLNALYHDGSQWQLAQSDNSTTLGLYVVIEVPDANTFIRSRKPYSINLSTTTGIL